MDLNSEIISLIDEIRDDRTHGASELARQAAGVLRVAAERTRADSAKQFLQEQRDVGGRLMLVRPSMAPVFNIVTHLLGLVSAEAAGMDLSSIRRLTMAKADEAVSDSLQAVAQIVKYGCELVADNERIMTHSYSSTVAAALKEAFNERKDIEVIVTRSGPGRTGEEVARQLGLLGIPITFIDDAAMGLYMPEVNRVLVGADRVCADGSVVNGVGTSQVALAAKRAGVPFYVLCETLKFDPRLRGDEVDLEEKGPSEVAELGRLPLGVKVRNPYFDVTSPELIAGIVTENGLLTTQEAISYMKKQAVKGS
jgi:ribose 1,5-bisphosphate isomerase